MKLICTKRPVISRWSFALLGLALAVFTWGLQYKLSLYAPPQAAGRHMAKAKLIFKDERAQVIDRVSLPGKEAPPPSLHLGEFLLMLPIMDAPVRFESRAAETTRQPAQSGSVWASSNTVFLRPPPALA